MSEYTKAAATAAGWQFSTPQGEARSGGEIHRADKTFAGGAKTLQSSSADGLHENIRKWEQQRNARRNIAA